MTEKNNLTHLKAELQKLQSAIQTRKGLKGMISDKVLDGILQELESGKQHLENQISDLGTPDRGKTAAEKRCIIVSGDVQGSVISGDHNTVAGNGSTIIRTRGGIHANVIHAVNVVEGMQVNMGNDRQESGIKNGFHPPPAPPSREGSLKATTLPSREGMPKIFLSYATEDYETAQKLYQDLKDRGINIWMDREDLLPGQNWRVTITRVIRECKAFIVLLSSNSLSKGGFVQKELKMALDILDEFPSPEIFLIPVRIDRCEPQEDKLRDLHRVDLSVSYEKGVEKILQSLAQIHNENS